MLTAFHGASSNAEVCEIDRLSAIAEVGRRDWSLLATGLYQSYDWLCWAEQQDFGIVEYLTARNGSGELLGVAPVYLVSEPPTGFTAAYDPIKVFLHEHADVAGADRMYPLLLIGSISGYSSDLPIAEGLDQQSRRRIVTRLLDACQSRATEASVNGIGIMYAPEEIARVAAEAFGDAFLIPTSADGVIGLPDSGSFEDYLARFPAARRSKLKKEVRTYTEAGGAITRCRLSDVAPAAGRLLALLQERYGNCAGPAAMTDYLTSQARFLDDHSVVFADWSGEQLRGFALCYVHGRTLYVRAAGFDYDASLPYSYFNLVVYESVRYAMENGLTSVDLGTGAYPAKVLRGATIRPSWSAIRIPSDVARRWGDAFRQPAAEALEAGWIEAGRELP